MADSNGDVIKSFLVGLGFDVDENSLAAFNKSIQTAALRITGLYGAVNAFAGGIVFAFSKISEGFEEMGYQFHIIAPAINKAIYLRQELLKAYSAAGISIRKTIIDSIRLNLSLTKTKYALEAIYKSVGSKFFGLLQKQSDSFRKRLYENMPYIISALTHLVSGVFKAFGIATQLGGALWNALRGVWDFFVRLDKATDGWSTKLIGLTAAWKLLNLEFLATPLGALIGGILALVALYDDFKVWKQGGKSFFNWKSAVPVIEAISRLLKDIEEVFIKLGSLAKDLWDGKWKKAMDDVNAITAALWDMNAPVDAIVRKLTGGALLDWRDSIDKKFFGLTDSFFGGSLFPNGMFPSGAPLGSTSPVGGNTNVNLHSQTSVNVTGTANPFQTAESIASAQGGVNRDLTRNVKGATR